MSKLGGFDMNKNEVYLSKMTRREFREKREKGFFEIAIIPTGSVEQHLEHLALEQDIACSNYIAEQVASQVYPKAVLAVPISVGIAEHHMGFPGTLSVRPHNWLGVIFDIVESFLRHGITKILLLNGHGGNVGPLNAVKHQWELYFKDQQNRTLLKENSPRIHTHHEYEELSETMPNVVDFRFHSYWDFIPENFAKKILKHGKVPGHAGEFETSIAMWAIPENVRKEAFVYSHDPDISSANSEKGSLLGKKAIDGVRNVIEEMLNNS